MRKEFTDWMKQFLLLIVVLLFHLVLHGCGGLSEGDSGSSSAKIEFELQQYPVNSELYTYEDSSRFKEAMASFQLEPGLRIELVAAEPLVVDPVAFAFDEDRKMYVVENRGYPDPAEGGEATHLGRIALLEDRDNDGRFDQRTEFATGLTYPNGILPWKGGVFVTCAPDIFYFKDTNGDGRADIKKVVLTGFNDNRTAQIRVSHPILGMDGWIYVTSGLNGGEVVSPEHPDRPPVSFSASDGRFHPETLEFKNTGGRSQFGLTFDAFGRRFGCSNRHPMQHIVLDPKYLKRNPHLLFNETIQNVAKAEAEATVFPISNAVTSADFIPNLIGRSHKGTFTSACGVLVYNGTGLGPDHQGNSFICEPAQNLLQRQIIHPFGVTFRSELPYEGREFLASTDTWFNPVFLGHGPEGALYVADMYRKVIDHPSYVPEEARGDLDFESGKDAGRIYRIVNKSYNQADYEKPDFLSSSSTTEQLVQGIQSTEEWVRSTSFRLLLEQKDDSAAPLLKQIAQGAGLAESRTLALWLLQALEALEPTLLQQAFLAEEAEVREQAIMLGEDLYARHPGLSDILIAGARDKAQRVRFSSALMLGSLEDEKAIPALAQIAAKDGQDPWFRAAVLSGIGNCLQAFLNEFRDLPTTNSPAYAEVMQDLGRLFGNAATIEGAGMLLKDMIVGQGDYSWRISTALGLVEGIGGRSELSISDKGLLNSLLAVNPSQSDRITLENFIKEVTRRAKDEEATIRARVVATALLGYHEFETSGEVFQELLDAKNPPEIQMEAVAALSRLGDAKGGALLTKSDTWSSYTPRVKSAVIAALVSSPTFINILFLAIEDGIVGPAEVPSTQRQRLMKDKDPKISKKAAEIFKELEAGGRMQVYQDYREVLDLPADVELGKQVFQKNCSSCHTYAGEGGAVGPDLTGVNNQPADALLLHTLVPNYEVLPAYQAIAVETKDGRSLSGWLLGETDNSLTLRTAFGTEEPILRANIVAINNSGLSLMPDGLEQTMTKNDLANLIAYLKSGG